MRHYLPRLSDDAQRWARFLSVLVGSVLLAMLVLRLQGVLTPIAISWAIAYILNPLVTWLEKRNFSRIASITCIYVLGFGTLTILMTLLLTDGIVQVNQLVAKAPSYIQQGREWLSNRYPGLTTRAASPAQFEQLLKEHGAAAAAQLTSMLVGFFSDATKLATALVLIPMYTFFFLWKFNDFTRKVHDLLPATPRPTIVRIFSTIDEAISSFFRGRLIICLVMGVLMALGWWFVGVPYSLPLGLLMGLLNLVPFLSIIVLPPALFFSYMDAAQAGQPWFWPVVMTLIAYTVVQAIESFVLTPYIGGHSTGLHPITTVVALLIGAEAAGLLGMLLAVPAASTLKTLSMEYVLPEIRRLAAGQDEENSGGGAAST